MAFLRRLVPLITILAVPASIHAQEAVLTGTVTDSTGGVLPGVTVTALLEATGNRFEAITAEAFNVFNRPNWTITTQESSPQYLQRTSGENRTMQFGVRLTF